MGRPGFKLLAQWPGSKLGSDAFSEADFDDSEDRSSHYEEPSSPCLPRGRRETNHRSLLPYVLHFILISSTLCMLLYGSVHLSLATDQMCLTKLNAYSPVIDSEVVQHEWQYWDDSQAENMYRGPPTVERELAWLDLWMPSTIPDGGVPVPLEKVAELNRTIDETLQRTTSGAAAGFIEVFHNIHCIATLRQWFYKDEYMERLGRMPAVFDKDPDQQVVHIEHCIERLRLAVMCSADLSVTFVYEDPTAPLGASPDFNGGHKCRNFFGIKDWVENAIIKEKNRIV